jgi:hypothetical protein
MRSSFEKQKAPAPRRFLTGGALDSQIRQDIAELYAERGVVLITDLIRIGYSRTQVHEFRNANP